MERGWVQTFPKDIKLTGTKSAMEQIIGNAVPVKLAEFVGKALNERMKSIASSALFESRDAPLFQPMLFEQKAKYAVAME
jgi:DNA (cytosine-5)-methyltransferase 1